MTPAEWTCKLPGYIASDVGTFNIINGIPEEMSSGIKSGERGCQLFHIPGYIQFKHNLLSRRYVL